MGDNVQIYIAAIQGECIIVNLEWWRYSASCTLYRESREYNNVTDPYYSSNYFLRIGHLETVYPMLIAQIIDSVVKQTFYHRLGYKEAMKEVRTSLKELIADLRAHFGDKYYPYTLAVKGQMQYLKTLRKEKNDEYRRAINPSRYLKHSASTE